MRQRRVWGMLAILVGIGEHFAGKIPEQLAAQEGEDVPGAEIHGGIVEQSLVKLGQLAAVGEQHVGAVLGLLDRPIVAAPLQPRFAQDRIELTRPTLQLPDPRQAAESVGQPLGSLERRGDVGTSL